MELTESLKIAENSLRDLINYILTKKFGSNWYDSCGLDNKRIKVWKGRKLTDDKKLGTSEPRLIYYSDIYDIKPIIKNNWDFGFSDVFKKLREIQVFLDLLESFRNPEAHRRELLPYQKYLAIGISGKIRSDVTRYFSEMETGDAYYPRLESVQDSLGNNWSIGERNPLMTGNTLRPGNQLQFKVSATDPLGEILLFAISPMVHPYEIDWTDEGEFDLTIKDKHVQERLWITIAVKSSREFHATSAVRLGKVDDVVKFGYEVLPPR
ncbi:MAG: hypothetical protein WD607_06860 [Candidatus Paceibacterota bacterium]